MPSKFFSTLPREPGSDCPSGKCDASYRPVVFIFAISGHRSRGGVFRFMPLAFPLRSFRADRSPGQRSVLAGSLRRWRTDRRPSGAPTIPYASNHFTRLPGCGRQAILSHFRNCENMASVDLGEISAWRRRFIAGRKRFWACWIFRDYQDSKVRRSPPYSPNAVALACKAAISVATARIFAMPRFMIWRACVSPGRERATPRRGCLAPHLRIQEPRGPGRSTPWPRGAACSGNGLHSWSIPGG